ncbi:MAG TPA: helix-turn-helix domain-containing protein [Longimicrobiales bacterium]|nr:helix-turn-helix domain-containing protein [Longimicrobiales bacterium]
MKPLDVSLLVLPDAMLSSLGGMYDVLNSFPSVSTVETAVPSEPPFRPRLVGERAGRTRTASGLGLDAHQVIDEVERTDIVIVPSLMVKGGVWETGRHPGVVRWLRLMHSQGAMVCSACSGVLVIAETGLLDGREATVHWAYARTFRRNFPQVRLRVEKVLVTTGDRREFVMSGASASWHDLILYLIARHVGTTAAQAISRMLLLQWHPDGQAPYALFTEPTDHGDGAILKVQEWVARNYTVEAPVAEMATRSGLPTRTFVRRFKQATGYTPIDYVQHLRIREAQRRLERTNEVVDAIGWSAGYEDPASFRRLFKRLVGVTPAEYRRKFRVPEFTGL